MSSKIMVARFQKTLEVLGLPSLSRLLQQRTPGNRSFTDGRHPSMRCTQCSAQPNPAQEAPKIEINKRQGVAAGNEMWML
eukprot:1768607-Amphidinium_carterae.1